MTEQFRPCKHDAEQVGATPHAHSYVATQFAGYKETLPTLRASGGDLGGGSEGLILIIDSHPADSRFDVFSDQITPTITRHVVKGGSEGPLILEVADGVSERGKRAVSADNDEEDSEHT